MNYICTLVAIIAIFIASSYKAQSKLPDSVYPDSNSSVSYCKLNDSTLNVMITIKHYKFIDEYSIIRNISYHKICQVTWVNIGIVSYLLMANQ